MIFPDYEKIHITKGYFYNNQFFWYTAKMHFPNLYLKIKSIRIVIGVKSLSQINILDLEGYDSFLKKILFK